ncbi:hypothetical protein ATANTOWER_026542 [Ataeniobius toweri]|uniref:Uncharacterized protein n=1 Tax=Ataeniobius toweri TaxID=208326 RepID=A0ABU7A861_9TELE|nr:hypothetical protein [Ataeniobius toweri]
MRGFSPGTLASSQRSCWLTGLSTLPLGVNECVHGCLSCVSVLPCNGLATCPGCTVAMVAVTGGLSVGAPAMSVSVVVSLGETLHPPCLLIDGSVAPVYGSLTSVSLSQGSCGLATISVYHCQW